MQLNEKKLAQTVPKFCRNQDHGQKTRSSGNRKLQLWQRRLLLKTIDSARGRRKTEKGLTQYAKNRNEVNKNPKNQTHRLWHFIWKIQNYKVAL